jgi:hypothetical protein
MGTDFSKTHYAYSLMKDAHNLIRIPHHWRMHSAGGDPVERWLICSLTPVMQRTAVRCYLRYDAGKQRGGDE